MEKIEKAHVLLIEDDAIWARFTAELISDIAEVSYDVVIAPNYEQAVARMKQGGFDICLVDVRLGNESGIDLIREASRYMPLCPVVLVTGLDQDPELEESAVDAGATDLIYKDELDMRALRRVLHMALLRREANRRLQQESIIDGLTGAFNRAHFDTCLAVEWQRCQRSGDPLSVMIIDLDCFKAVNDDNSHQAGDLLLQSVTNQLEVLARKTDIVARLGGDEFAILLPKTNASQAAAAATKMVQGIRSVQVVGHEHILVSASIGVSSSEQGHLTGFALLRAADAACYAAKNAGRDQAISWEAGIYGGA